MTTLIECRHHFILNMPNGPTSEGRCKLCGEVRYFSNSLDATLKESFAPGRSYQRYMHVPAAEVTEEIRQLRAWID